MEPIDRPREITYSVGRIEAWRVNWWLYWRENEQRWSFGAVVAVLLPWYLWKALAWAPRAAVLWTVVGLPGAIALLGVLVASIGAVLPGVVGHHHDTILPEGLRGTNAVGKTQLLSWNWVRRIERTPVGIVLTGSVLAIFIPASAFRSEAEEEEFFQQAMAMWERAPKGITRQRRPLRPTSLLGASLAYLLIAALAFWASGTVDSQLVSWGFRVALALSTFLAVATVTVSLSGMRRRREINLFDGLAFLGGAVLTYVAGSALMSDWDRV